MAPGDLQPNRSFRQRKYAIAALALTTLIFLAIFLTAIKPQPQISVHHVFSNQSSNFVIATFEVLNQTKAHYRVLAIAVEARTGTLWNKCLQLSSQAPGTEQWVQARASAPMELALTNVPCSTPLRLRCSVQKELTGIQTLLPRIWARLRGFPVPLSPWANRYIFLGASTQIVTDQFIEQPPPTDNALRPAPKSLLAP